MHSRLISYLWVYRSACSPLVSSTVRKCNHTFNCKLRLFAMLLMKCCWLSSCTCFVFALPRWSLLVFSHTLFMCYHFDVCATKVQPLYPVLLNWDKCIAVSHLTIWHLTTQKDKRQKMQNKDKQKKRFNQQQRVEKWNVRLSHVFRCCKEIHVIKKSKVKSKEFKDSVSLFAPSWQKIYTQKKSYKILIHQSRKKYQCMMIFIFFLCVCTFLIWIWYLVLHKGIMQSIHLFLQVTNHHQSLTPCYLLYDKYLFFVYFYSLNVS